MEFTQHDPGRLTERQRTILKLIVQEYVASGRPVGSKTLTERYPIGVSPATIRHEMVELEQAGFIHQAHTSGGRIPTDQGYRYYVHHLMGAPELSSGDQIMIRHQFRQVEFQLDQWVEFAASVLAETAGNISIVSAPRTITARLRHFELISLQPRVILLILVTQETVVRQMMVHLHEDADQSELSRIADTLAPAVRGLTADEIDGRVVGSTPLAREVLDQVMLGLRGLDSVEHTQIRHSGLENILGQPEFSGEEAQSVLELMRGGSLLGAVLPQLTSGGGVQVFIGDENPADALRRFGVVMATYGIDGEVTGILGVLGPTRMPYWRSISSVRYMARLMSDLMEDLYSS
ncbi:MAG TPA: heat-inducible transcriptional repressor HrcA [Thermomicrobiales bacterium]|nr:heat-inducible transcriptional repressor HrcA [Thermomicrobiales bacterium]